MNKFKITGNPNPVVGTEEFYSVNELLPSALPFQNLGSADTNPFEPPVEWSVHLLEYGRWVQKKENNKIGNKVSYTFLQKSLDRDGIRIIAERGMDSSRIDIKPHKAESPKIFSVELLDHLGNKPTEPFAYGQTLKARVHCLHLEHRRVYATLWEDDAVGAGHNKANEKNKMKTLFGTVKGGIADIDFVLEPDFAKIANAIKAKGDADEGETHEYYVTAEVFNKVTASANTNVANPDYKTPTPAAPKRQTPAQKKGPSKKHEKEKTFREDIIDWWEGTFKVKPVVAFDPKPPTGNTLLKVGVPDKDPKDEKKDNKNNSKCFCDRDITPNELINLGISKVNTENFLDSINSTIKNYNINSCKRKLHFLAQVRHESGEFAFQKEIWGPTAAQLGYESRKDLGNIETGDGKRFMGRGLIQMTGRTNYANYGTFKNENFLIEPNNKKIGELPYCVDSAGWYWSKNLSVDLNDYADKDDIIYITYRINGGFNGYFSDRKPKLIEMIKATECTKTKFDNYDEYSIKNSKVWDIHDAIYKYASLNMSDAKESYKRFLELTDDYLNWNSMKGIENKKNREKMENKRKKADEKSK